MSLLGTGTISSGQLSQTTAPATTEVSVDSDRQITVKWTDTTDDGQYHIQQNRDGNGYVDPAGGSITVPTVTDYFGANSKGYFHPEVEILGPTDGFDLVGKADASTNSGFEDVFTDEFQTSDFADSGSGNNVYMAFAAKWDNIPNWGYQDTWVKKPAPDPNNYQLYVLKADGQNGRDEYFRLYYDDSDTTSVGYIADPVVWKGYQNPSPTDARIVGSASDRTVRPLISKTYGPNSDQSYDSTVGIDSAFQFRVRTEAGNAQSSWTETQTCYTTPVPPHNPSVSRPDANTVEISWTVQSDVKDYSLIEVREDTGSGYGDWRLIENEFTETKGSTVSVTTSVDDNTAYNSSLNKDARYQFRLQNNSPENPDGAREISDSVYADYGNSGNVFFEDDFESGDLSAWDSSPGFSIDSDGHPDTGISGADEGTYYVSGLYDIDNDGNYLQKNLGDLSGESDVFVKLAMATGSMDNDWEWTVIDWYDGSSWQEIEAHGSEYNEQGWVEVHADIPDSYLSTDNRLRLGGRGGLGGGDQHAYDRVVVSDVLHEHTQPSAPSNLQLESSTQGEVTLSWTDNSSLESQFIRRRKKSSDSSWQDFKGLGTPNQTSYTETGLLDGEKYEFQVYSRVRQDRHGERGPSNYYQAYGPSNDVIVTLPAPSGVGATVQSNRQIDLDWTDVSNYGDYHIQIERDDSGYTDSTGGPSIVGHDTTNASYTPSHDDPYDSFVGFDSKFSFRIRSETEHTTSSWVTSENIYTEPAAPYDVSVSRPNASTIQLHGTVKSDTAQFVKVDFREDTGSGYGSWKRFDYVTDSEHPQLISGSVSTKGSDFTIEWDVGTQYQYDTLQSNARYQFRVTSGYFSTASDNSAYSEGKFVYADYGNKDNVFFEDSFEDQDFAEWDSTTGGTQRSGSYADLGVSGAYDGTYYATFDDNDDIVKNLGDLSSESDIVVQAVVASGSLDSTGEYNYIQWYDGSTWQDLETFGWEYNEHGWVFIRSKVPDSWLATDNRLRFQSHGGGGADYFAVDHVVVSDVLDEYTKPAAPSGFTASGTNNRHELTASWTNEAANLPEFYNEIKHRITDSGNGYVKDSVNESSSVTFNIGRSYSGMDAVPERDGEKYDVRVDALFTQYRRGSASDWYHGVSTDTAVSKLPAPSSVSATVQANDHIDVDWTDETNYGDYHIQINRESTGYVDPDGGSTIVGHDTTSESYGPHGSGGSSIDYDASVGIDSDFQFRVRSETEHTNSSWVSTSTVYTDPIPPYNVSVSRPDGETFTFSWTNQSTIATNGRVEIYYREDAGSGFDSWSWLDQWTISNLADPTQLSVSVSDYSELQIDSRYQFKFNYKGDNYGGNSSEAVFTDYGNDNSVYFEDDFSSGDASAWTSTSFNTGSVTDSLDVDFSNGNQSPQVGGYAVQFGDAGHVQRDLGDLSGESDVHVRLRVQAASNDNSGENGDIWWYDGSNWQNLKQWGHEHDSQGWMEYHVPVPDSYLSTDNRIRIGRDEGGGADWIAFDEVVVSDILHEYTTPAAPSNPTVLDTTASVTVDGKDSATITVDWTDNASFPMTFDKHWRKEGYSSWDTEWGGGKPYKIPESYNPRLEQGQKYEIEIGGFYRQYRHGTRSTKYWAPWSNTITETTPLPAPTALSTDSVGSDTADISWTNQDNDANGYRVYLEDPNDLGGMQFSGLGTTEQINIGDVDHDGSPTFSACVRLRYDTLNVDSNNNWRNVIGSNGKDNFLLVEEHGQPTFRAPGSNKGFMGPSADVQEGQIHTITVTYDGSTKEAYLDGGNYNSESVSNSSIDLSGFYIGGNSSNHNPDGVIYDVALYDRVLSSSEASSWADGTLPSDPIGYWPLDVTNSGTTPDCSQYANEGTINGPSLTSTAPSDLSGQLGDTSSSYTISNLTDGRTYRTFVHAETEHTETRDQ